ncbi:hypothetical protein DV113_000918 [Geotrichum candidum]|nr:hypothetical protein DV452_000712 [Geotrichum candidum]KAF7501075.1 hypothetical protein DV113_000918 [Geotrichum candidum]KAI8132083.1 hypothetical protein DUD61_004254 [Geotrichum candidum]KAI9210437.1 hypothetical protein DS838_004690 [Geotrichum bryndzae]
MCNIFAFKCCLPLYYVSRNWYEAWTEYTKQLFGIVVIFITQYWTPLKVSITGNSSVAGLFSINAKTGLLETHFDGRAIVISNHQLYSDWIFLWWVAFTARYHGNIFIMLKDSLKHIPIFGWGMRNYRFLFLSRSWVKDEKTLTEGLSRINRDSDWPAWLILFPEGTTISRNGVAKSRAFAEKQTPALRSPSHLLLPRSRGLRFSIEQLHETVEYIYDSTIYYSDIPEGVFGEDHFTLRRMYLQGVYPSSIAMYWRRYRIADIPWQDEAKFEKWIYDRWYEKDALLQHYHKTGQFTDPENEAGNDDIPTLEAPVRLSNTVGDVFKIFVVPITTGLLVRLGYNALTRIASNAF